MTRSTEYHPRARGGSARGRQVSSRRVRDLILASIREGTLDLDTQLVEEDLIRMFNSSRAAVRDALNELSDAGFLVRRPRLGTRVHRRDLGLELTAISGIGGESVEIVIREQRLVPNLPLVRTRLNIHDDHVRLVENTFHAFGETIGLRSAYFSASHDADPTELAGIPLTMERTAAEFFGTDPGDAWVSIGAERCDERTGQILGVPAGSTLLMREITYTTSDGAPFQIVFDRFRADFVRFETRHDHRGVA